MNNRQIKCYGCYAPGTRAQQKRHPINKNFEKEKKYY